jgi:hypothetical protein
VAQQQEPAVFDVRVRQRGAAYLAQVPHPTTKQFRSHNYWVEVLAALHDAYRGICSYSCHWIPYDTGADTVEHFLPKAAHPAQAYEWSNYRLVCQTLNGRKGTYEDLLDPFHIQTGWFWIDFPSLLVKPADGLDPVLAEKVIDTRDRLGLNDEGTCLKARQRYVKDMCVNGLPFQLVERDAPFLAGEIRRQGLVVTLNDVMGYPPPP